MGFGRDGTCPILVIGKIHENIMRVGL